ncbi:MAG: nucleoside deaminase [Blastochloris sp.]|nr:nucleoside deaminase [Blastochloris sp.]
MTESESFMLEALRLAREGMQGNRGGPFGAVIVKQGQVIARGQNRVTSDLDPTAHAEVVAIREACRVLGRFDLRGCEIYSSCEPCPMCLASIYWARLDRLTYAGTREDAAGAGFDDAVLYSELPKESHERTLPCQTMLREDAQQLFAEWNLKTDKVLY